jgi:hypothetical protein
MSIFGTPLGCTHLIRHPRRSHREFFIRIFRPIAGAVLKTRGVFKKKGKKEKKPLKNPTRPDVKSICISFKLKCNFLGLMLSTIIDWTKLGRNLHTWGARAQKITSSVRAIQRIPWLDTPRGLSSWCPGVRK